MTKNKVGRPKKINKALLQKLRVAFQMGYTDEEACIYADIAPQTLYNYQNENVEFLEQKNEWKKSPILKAKKTLYKNLKNPKFACWYLERKCKDEYILTQKQELSGGINVQKIFITEKEKQETDEHIDNVINEQ